MRRSISQTCGAAEPATSRASQAPAVCPRAQRSDKGHVTPESPVSVLLREPPQAAVPCPHPYLGFCLTRLWLAGGL